MFSFIAVLVVAVFASFALSSSVSSNATEDDPEVSTSEEGGEVPVLFGSKTLSSSNIVWYGDVKTRAIKSSSGK